MDATTADLLTKWGMLEYISAFSAARIDISALEMMTDDEIKELIPIIGDRLKFKANIRLLKEDASIKPGPSSAVVNADISNTLNSSFVSEIFNFNPLSTASVIDLIDEVQGKQIEENAENLVLEILKQTPEGRSILNQRKRSNGLLSHEQRKVLTTLIINSKFAVDCGSTINTCQFLKLAQDIGKLFKEESPDSYFTPYIPANQFQPKRNASGYLYNGYATRKRRYRELGFLPPSAKRGRHEVNQEVDLAIDLDHMINEDESSKSNLEALEGVEVLGTPWQVTEALWKGTVKARLYSLYHQKGTLKNYFERFPILKTPTAYKLLVNDFDALYPGKGKTFFTTFPQSVKGIIHLATSRALPTKDETVKKVILGYLETINDDCPETSINAALLLLAFVINISPARKKKSAWKPTRLECRDGYITQVASASDIGAVLTERRLKLAALGGTLQPFILFCGLTIQDISKVFVVCEETLYEFPSLLCAVDITFKIFQVTATEYPQEAYDIWLLIQRAFYDIRTKYDRPVSSVKAILVDLGFKDRV